MRDAVIPSYLKNMSNFIAHETKDDLTDIQAFIKTYIDQHIQIPTISNVIRKEGSLVCEEKNLVQFIQETDKRKAIISPSGSTYVPPSTKRSIVSYLQTDLKDRRNRAKKAMKEAIKKDLKAVATNENFRQANAKIGANAVSGITKSAGNLFYDVGTYNAITSIARTVVSLSAEIIEQFICGNFSFFSIDEIINHIVLCKQRKPSDESIMECVHFYNLKIPTLQDVIVFLCKSTWPYYYEISKPELYKKIHHLVKHLTETELIFLFYQNNLKHLFMHNTETMKPLVEHIFSGAIVGSGANDAHQIHQYSEDILFILTTCNDHILHKRNLDEMIESDPEGTSRLIDIATHYLIHISKFDKLMDTFILNNWIPPYLGNIKNKLRNSILLVDTDSNIFTTIPWIKWFTPGGEFTNDIRNYQIHSLIVYLITKNVSNILGKYARSLGVEEKDVSKLNMKNEFLYPGLIILDIKKNYAGLITIVEGLVRKEPKLDIKGVTLRSSSICQTSRDWFQTFLVDIIFKTSIERQLNAEEVISEIVEFENRIRSSLNRGETTFLKHTSIRTETGYDKSESSAFVYADAWNIIFGPTLDTVILPTKCPLINIVEKVPQTYFDMLNEQYNDIYRNFLKYTEKYGKLSSAIALHPMADRIPEALIPIIDIRKIIYHNIAPAYTVLRSIGLNMGYKKKGQLLFSDVYLT